jgi:hypothetical protein
VTQYVTIRPSHKEGFFISGCSADGYTGLPWKQVFVRSNRTIPTRLSLLMVRKIVLYTMNKGSIPFLATVSVVDVGSLCLTVNQVHGGSIPL